MKRIWCLGVIGSLIGLLMVGAWWNVSVTRRLHHLQQDAVRVTIGNITLLVDSLESASKTQDQADWAAARTALISVEYSLQMLAENAGISDWIPHFQELAQFLAQDHPTSNIPNRAAYYARPLKEINDALESYLQGQMSLRSAVERARTRSTPLN